jgi:hypothetical protein
MSPTDAPKPVSVFVAWTPDDCCSPQAAEHGTAFLRSQDPDPHGDEPANLVKTPAPAADVRSTVAATYLGCIALGTTAVCDEILRI